MRAEALKGHLDSLILAVLAAGPLHGYAVIEELKRRSGGQLALPEGTVYPALHRLERARLLSSAWSGGARRRRVYELTAKGRRELTERRGDWRRFSAAVEAVLA
jgi:PadR family transcriptional regulator PadR